MCKSDFYRFQLVLLVVACITGVFISAVDATAEEAIPNLVHDCSIQPPDLITFEDDFVFTPPPSREAWETRAAGLKRRIAVATGLFPMLPRPAVRATMHSKFQRDGFVCSKVYFESLPGHFVTGLLFEPTERASSGGKFPGILCPHGHNGRLQTHTDDEMEDFLRNGGEVHPDSGSMPKIARCVHLARLGCVVFIFDMLGYGDSNQLSYKLAHFKEHVRPGELAPGRDAPQLFGGTPAVARLQSTMGLQTFNALRSLDLLASLPNVDAERLAVTGGSGGATQTIMLSALDDRVAASFPNGMVSTSMQGGCTCENACYLRIGTCNAELAALMAPKPMAMTAADDWTKDMMRDGYPQLQEVYRLYEKEQNVQCTPLLQYEHNYNYVTRSLMYRWFNEHLQLGYPSVPVENDFPRLTGSETAVWNDQHPAPSDRGEAHEANVLSWWSNENQRRIAGGLGAAATADVFESCIQPAIETIFDVAIGLDDELELTWDAQTDTDDSQRTRRGRIIDSNFCYPVLWVQPGSANRSDTIVIRPVAVDRFSDEDIAGDNRFLGSDESSQNLWITMGRPVARQTMNDDSGAQSAAYTFGYNRPHAVKQTRRILAAIKVANGLQAGRVELDAESVFASSALAAAALSGNQLDDARISIEGFRFGSIATQDDPEFVPGMVKYGDVDAIAGMRAPNRLTLYDSEPSAFSTATALYSLQNASASLTILPPRN